MFLKQDDKGDWYVTRRTVSCTPHHSNRTMLGRCNRDWWLPKYRNNYQLQIGLRNLIVPLEFLGKKIRLKVEVVKEYDKPRPNLYTRRLEWKDTLEYKLFRKRVE